MVYFSENMNICSMCESSTPNKVFLSNGKHYCLCECCRNIIEFVVKGVIKQSKGKKND